MIRFEDILDKVETYKPDFDEELLQKAYIFSAREHRGQVRDSGEPYLVHPLYVAYILADLHLDETSIAVGLLHDVLEDTLTTKEKLQELRRDIEGEGGKAYVYPTDLSDVDACDAMIQKVLAEHDQVDILINNAGRSIRRKRHTSSPTVWETRSSWTRLRD